MYKESAQVYDALFRHKDYATASLKLREIVGRLVPHASTLLDVACGTGRHLEFLKEHYQVEGLDLSGEMLQVARERCPGVSLHDGNLVDFRIGRKFDVVCCLFGSIGYAKTIENLDRSVRCMASHLRSRGALIVEPWVMPERFIAGKLTFDTVNDPELKVARMYVARCEGRVSVYESQYLVGTPEGVTQFTERQELGLFRDEEYLAAFHKAGLDIVDLGTEELFGYGLYAGVTNGEDCNP